jgi:mono/diheme cytochrome c family protein
MTKAPCLAVAGLCGFASLVGAGQRAEPATFSRDVAPILFEHCVTCHRPDGSAPFSLATYADARPWARAIRAQVLERRMPPWKPEPGYNQFAGERRLTEEAMAVIEAWADGGAPEGDPAALPPTPALAGRWQLGEPDVVLETATYTLRAAGDDVYRNFVLPVPVAGTRYIKAWEFLPGNPRVVHHATMQLDGTGSARRLDAADPQPGYEGLIPHAVKSPDGFFLDWGPGHAPYVAPDGMAWPVLAGMDMVMMLHLRPDGQEETVQGRLGLYFSDAPPTLRPTLIRLTRQHLDIPPGESAYVVTDSFTLGVDVDVHTVQPHAHYLARQIEGFATLPDGTRRWLIYIRDWDFDWQGVFRYAEVQSLPAGTTLTMEYTYDNSAANPRNPNRPPRRVTYGQDTSNEMAELWFQVVTRTAADRAILARDVGAKILREEIVGYEKMLEADPDNASLHDDVALLYAQAGELDRTAAHFAETRRLRPDSASAHFNVGAVLLLQGRREAAADAFEAALALDAAYGRAHDSLGRVRQAQGRFAEAADHYRRALVLDPASPAARAGLDEVERALAR